MEQEAVYSTNRPPLFDSNNFSWWKKRMRVFIESVDPQLWDIIEKGPLKITTLDETGGTIDKPRAYWNDNDYKKQKKNAQALNLLYCSLNNQDFAVVSNCKTAKEVWDALNEIFEGTDSVQMVRKGSLLNKYGSFKMEEDESVKDMLRRFMTLVNQLKLLGDDATDSFHVLKVLDSLSLEFDEIVEEINDEISEEVRPDDYYAKLSLKLNVLLSRLLAYEEVGLVTRRQISKSQIWN